MMLNYLLYLALTPLLLLVLLLIYLAIQARKRGYFPAPKIALSSVVVITGCDTGIGRFTALHLSKLGFHVVVTVLNAENGESLKQEAANELSWYKVDITDESQILEFAKQLKTFVESNNKAVVGLVNNAGIAVMGPLEFITHSAMQLQLNVNLVGHNSMTGAVLPLIRQSKGRIVNIVSCAGRTAAILMGPYCASKFGMEAITDSLRLELHQYNISVSAIEPGFIRTPLVQNVAENFDSAWDRLAPEARDIYKRQYDIAQSGMQTIFSRAPSPAIVAKAITHALVNERPKTRYLVGSDALVYAAVAYLPDRMRDALLELVSILAKSKVGGASKKVQ